MLHELEFAHSDSTSPLPVSLDPTPMPKQEISQPPIMIPPPNVDMKDSISHILYLSSSTGSMYWNTLGVSYGYHVEPSLENTFVSTSIDVSYTSHLPTPFDDGYVNLAFHEYALGSSSSCSHCSSSLPIF